MGSPKHAQDPRRSGIGGPDDMMTHHTVVHLGWTWTCYRCERELGRFGAGMPVTTADCTPRRWADGAPS